MNNNMYKTDDGKTFKTLNPVKFGCWKYGNQCGEYKNGECTNCYCYVKHFPDYIRAHFSQETPQFNMKAFDTKFQKGDHVFLCDCTDLFHEKIPDNMIKHVLNYAAKQPDVNFYIQSKCTQRMADFLTFGSWEYPDIFKHIYFGTTIETPEYKKYSKAQDSRFKSIREIKSNGFKTYITVEPILSFGDTTPQLFATSLLLAYPNRIWIGADSKCYMQNKLPEPSENDVIEFITALNDLKEKVLYNVQITLKSNLRRIVPQEKLNDLMKIK